MSRPSGIRKPLIAFALASILAFSLGPIPAGGAPDGVQITGTVLDQDGVTPVRGVTVSLRERATGQVYESRPSDRTGKYEIDGVPDGDYAIAVRTASGDFEMPAGITVRGGLPSIITVILTAAASTAAGGEEAAQGGRGGRAAILIPTIGAIFAGAYAADQIFEKDEDASPKLP